jgi:hypothetical protein
VALMMELDLEKEKVCFIIEMRKPVDFNLA